MTRRAIDTTIDAGLCTGCGECPRVCPTRAIEMIGGRAVVTGRWSLGCGHCAAVCPAGAVTVGGLDEGGFALATMEAGDGHVPPGGFDAPSLVRLMRSRRSCRNYRDRPVPLDLLLDLVKIGTTAPSGTNCQLWTFTVLPDRGTVELLGGAVAGFFRRLNRKAGSLPLRLLARLFAGDALGAYYRDHYESVEEGLRLWEKEGRDPLFHGAPAALIVGSRPGGTCPAEDALLASQNILLAAHAAGLGSCMVGFVVEAARHDSAIPRLLGIPPEEKIHAVIALGYPDEAYVAPAGRRPVGPRVVRLQGGGNA